MSRLTLELLRDPELQRIARQAYDDEMFAARSEGRLYDSEKMIEKMRALQDWRVRALRAEAKLVRSPRGGTPSER